MRRCEHGTAAAMGAEDREGGVPGEPGSGSSYLEEEIEQVLTA